MPEDDLRYFSKRRSAGPLSEMWAFLSHTRKWWLTPILIMFLLLSLLFMLGGTGAGPFVYTLF